MSLYHLTEELEVLLNDDEMSDEEIDEQIAKVCSDIQKKGDNISQFLKSLKAQSEAIDNEIKNLKTRKQSSDNKIDRIKQYALENMNKAGISEIGDLHKLKICKNGGKLPLIYTFDTENDDEIRGNVPERFIINKPLIDTEAVRAELDEGNEFTAFKYGERGFHIRVK